MNLLERYLQAIGQYLLTTTREDVLNELRVNLLEQIEAREDELARPLTEPELSTILQAHGRPEVVATRYLPQRSLIGPTIFPSYLLTLRRALPLVLLIYAIAQGASIIFTPRQEPLLPEIFRSIVHVIPTLLIFWASVTIVFAVIEFAHTRPGFDPKWMPTADWDPTKLPTVQDATQPKPKSFVGRVADLGFQILWTLYVLAVPSHPFLIIGPSNLYLRALHASFAPVWHTFYIVVIVLCALQLIIKAAALSPGARAWSAVMDVVNKLFSVAILTFLASSNTYFLPGDNTDLRALNHWTGIAFRIALFFAILGLLQQLWKYIRPRTHSTRLAF
jgi:hypothetical protein